jgi:hypothetical protein
MPDLLFLALYAVKLFLPTLQERLTARIAKEGAKARNGIQVL